MIEISAMIWLKKNDYIDESCINAFVKWSFYVYDVQNIILVIKVHYEVSYPLR